MNPKRFLSKIPNASVMRDFFVNQGKFYVPPKRDLTSSFCRVIYNIFIYLFLGCIIGKEKINEIEPSILG